MKKLRRFGRRISRWFSSFKYYWASRFSWLVRRSRVLWTFREKTVEIADGTQRVRPAAVNFLNPVFWVVQAFLFVSRYAASRPVLRLIQGLPAFLLMLMPACLAFWILPSQADVAVAARNRRDFLAERQEFEDAEFFARQLCFMHPENSDAVYERARILDRLDRSAECLSLMNGLAREAQYLPAIEWLCSRDLDDLKNTGALDEDREKQLVSSLTFMLQQQPKHINANLMLGAYYLSKDQHAKARSPLTVALQSSRVPLPDAAFSLALVLRSLGEDLEARRYASSAADAWIDRLSRQAYSRDLMLKALRALILSEREDNAAALVEETLPFRTDDEQIELRWVLGEIYASWCKRLRLDPRRTDTDLAVAVEAIYKGLAFAASNRIVIDELTQLACSTSLNDEQLERQLQICLDSGVSPGLVHFITGTRLLLQTPPQVTEAVQHLELAQTHDAALPGLLNNLAEALLRQESPDLERALTLVNQAIEYMPDQPYFFDTRGKVFLRQGHYLKAVADFERALAAPELRADVHRQLADAFGNLNNPAEQERHLQRAAAYQKQKDAELRDLNNQATADQSDQSADKPETTITP